MTNKNEIIDNFFKPGRLNVKEGNLSINNLSFNRMYLEYYLNFINAFKDKIPLEIDIKKDLKESSWEPLLQHSHHGIILTLKNFLPLNSSSESGKLLVFFDILQRCGFGTFDLGLAVPGSVMTIISSQTLENFADLTLEHKYETMASPFTAGMVLACYNLAMSSMPAEEITTDYIDKLYRESPQIIQSSYGLLNEESSFSFFL